MATARGENTSENTITIEASPACVLDRLHARMCVRHCARLPLAAERHRKRAPDQWLTPCMGGLNHPQAVHLSNQDSR